MHEFICFNQRIFHAAETFLPAVSAAALYGKGIFTTIAVYRGEPFLWEKHWRRLQTDAKKIGLDLSDFDEATIKDALLETIAKNDLINGRARLTFFDERANGIWKLESKRKTSFLMLTADFRAITDNFRLTISPFPTNSKSPLAGVKSCNYLENLFALDEAKKRGFDEAVRINERGEIASACAANIFWLKGAKLYTPAPATGCLNGTTREFLTEKFECFEIETSLENLQNADAIFLTSAGIGVVQASEFEDRKFAPNNHEITRIIRIKTE